MCAVVGHNDSDCRALLLRNPCTMMCVLDALIQRNIQTVQGQKVILHHPKGRLGANLYNVVGVTQSQHLAIHAITGYKNAVWDAVQYILGKGVF